MAFGLRGECLCLASAANRPQPAPYRVLSGPPGPKCRGPRDPENSPKSLQQSLGISPESLRKVLGECFLGVPNSGCFKPVVCNFCAEALFCALLWTFELRPCALICVFLRNERLFYGLSFALFCTHLRVSAQRTRVSGSLCINADSNLGDAPE